jgi:hypothetical protein
MIRGDDSAAEGGAADLSRCDLDFGGLLGTERLSCFVCFGIAFTRQIGGDYVMVRYGASTRHCTDLAGESNFGNTGNAISYQPLSSREKQAGTLS